MERDAFGIRRLLQSCAPAPQIDDALAASLSRRRHQCYIRRLRITDRGLEGLGCRILQVCRLCGDRRWRFDLWTARATVICYNLSIERTRCP